MFTSHLTAAHRAIRYRRAKPLTGSAKLPRILVGVLALALASLLASSARANSCTWESPYMNFNFAYNGIQLKNQSNGKIISNPSVTLDLWGSYWSNSGAADATRLVNAAGSMLSNPGFWTRMQQYGITGGGYGNLLTNDQTDIFGLPGGPGQISDGPATVAGTIQNRIQKEFLASNQIFPFGLPNNILTIILPPNVNVIDPNGQLQSWGSAYHNSFSFSVNGTNVTVVYAVIIYSSYNERDDFGKSLCRPDTTVDGACPTNIGPAKLSGSGNPGDASTETDNIGHEVTEATTDPFGNAFRSANPGSAAKSGSGNEKQPEIGDLCNSLSEWVNGVRWNQIWLQDQCRCDGNPYPAVPFLQGSPTWLNMPAGDSASDVGSGWVIGSAFVDSSGNRNIFQYHPDTTTWSAVPGAAEKVSVDLAGNPWVINSQGNIYKWHPATGSFVQFPSLPGGTAISVASQGNGQFTSDFRTDANTWAVRNDTTIWSWFTGGNNTSPPNNCSACKWQQVPGNATKISMFSQGAIGDGCNGGPTPFVVAAFNAIYRYQCSNSQFVFSSGFGTDISTDFTVDFAGQIDWWNYTKGSFQGYIAAPWGTDTVIGARANGLFAASRSGGQIAVITGR